MIVVALLIAAALEADGEADAALKRMPAPVRAFVERRMTCNHWAGEEAYDRARARQIASAVRTLRCERVDRDERALGQRYPRRADIRALLIRSRDWY